MLGETEELKIDEPAEGDIFLAEIEEILYEFDKPCFLSVKTIQRLGGLHLQ